MVLITDIEINARHNLLLQTIGVLQMEIEAYQTVSLFFILIPVIILLAILQLGFFTLYNGRFHPMSTILDAATTNDKEAGEYKYEVQIFTVNLLHTYSLLNFICVSLGSIIELAEKQQYVKEASKDDNEEVELRKNEVAMETVEIN